MALNQQQIIANNLSFLKSVNWKTAVMDSSTGVYKPGQMTSFTMDPTGGYARGIWVMGTVDVTVTLNSGAVVKSPFAPWNIFEKVRVKLGNVIHEVHPYAFPLVYQQSNNAGQQFTYPGPNPQIWAQTVLFGSLNGTTASWDYQVSAGENDWTFAFYVPLQFDPNDVIGLVPLGSSSNKLTIELLPTTSPYGTDPWVSPVVVTTAGATATIGANKNNLTCVVEYADMTSLQGPAAAGVVVPDPIITAAVYLRDNVTPYPAFGQFRYAYFEQPYTFQRLIAVLNDNYSSVNGPRKGALAQNTNLTGIRLNFDGQNVAREWSDATGGTVPFWMRQLMSYNTLFPEGIVSFDFVSGSDPRNPNGDDLLNAELFTQARIGLSYQNPNSGGAAPNGAYIWLLGQYIVPQAYSA